MKFCGATLIALAALVRGEGGLQLPDTATFLYAETFQEDFNWIKSSDADYQGQPVAVTVDKELKDDLSGDKSLILLEAAKKYGLVGAFKQPIGFPENDKPLVIQYEVKLTEGQSCGGAYLKLLQSGVDLENFNGQSPYTVMVGPDHCGTTNKIHFILQFKNPVSGVFEEKHAVHTATPFVDTSSHLYTLVIRPDNTWEILVDLESKAQGSLLEDMDPPINPAKTIDDPTDFKPEDWVDAKRIKDETATKPEDWDEDAPAKIPDSEAVMPSDWLLEEEPEIADPSAKMPDDWDEEEDGEWEAPLVKNPKCFRASGCGAWKPPMIDNPDFKGKWYAPLIDNPAYIGEWKAKQIDNPHYFEDLTPLKSFAPMSGVAVEIWTMTGGIRFDNIIVTDSEEEAASFGAKTWKLKAAAEKNNRKRLSKEERREELERKREEGGFSNLLEVYLNDLLEFCVENAMMVLGSLLVGLVGLVFMCSRSGNSAEGDAHEAQLRAETQTFGVPSSSNKSKASSVPEDEASDSSDENAAAEEEEDEEEDENTPSGNAKKVAQEEAEAEVDAEEKEKSKAKKNKNKK